MSKASATTHRLHSSAATGVKPVAAQEATSDRDSGSRPAPTLLLSIALVLILLANIGFGAVSVSPAEILVIVGRHVRAVLVDLPVVGAVWSQLGSISYLGAAGSSFTNYAGEVTRQEDAVVWAIRLPRTLLGLIIGAGLGVSGAAMQGMFRNPLADPGLIGVSTGAAFGAVLAIVLRISLFGIWTLPVFAFLAGVAGTVIVYMIARNDGRTEVITLILAGIALNAIAGAGVGFLISIADDQQLRSVTFWTLGSLAGSRWREVWIVGAVTLIGILVVRRYRETLNLFVLGEREARHLGVHIELVRVVLILLTAAMTGVAVAFAGAIGFVGLVVPHLIRLWLGPDHQHLIPLSALGGATLLLLADLASRTVAAPTEFPIGVTMSLVGGPFFIWLLLRTRRQQGGWG